MSAFVHRLVAAHAAVTSHPLQQPDAVARSAWLVDEIATSTEALHNLSVVLRAERSARDLGRMAGAVAAMQAHIRQILTMTGTLATVIEKADQERMRRDLRQCPHGFIDTDACPDCCH